MGQSGKARRGRGGGGGTLKAGLFAGLGGTEVPCSNPKCDRTWTWETAAQLAQLQKTGSKEPPSRLCSVCYESELELGDREIECRVNGCTDTWTWDAEAQRKARAWARGQGGGQGKGSKKKRKAGPPARMCERCADRHAQVEDQEIPCKVHGCTRTHTWDRHAQVEAWVSAEDADKPPVAPRRMCTVCRDYCRSHPDREVTCASPGCTKTWSYRTGAQLHDFLAGRLEPPARLCRACAAKDSRGSDGGPVGRTADGHETMPCIVPGCSGIWLYRPGHTQVAGSSAESLPPDRMCESCRESNARPESPDPARSAGA